VSAHQGRAGLMGLFVSSFEYFGGPEFVHGFGKAENVHGRYGPPAHCVHVGQSVGRGDEPEGVGVVDDGGEKVQSLYQGRVFGKTENSGVVGQVEADDQIGVVFPRQQADQFAQVARTQLRSSAGCPDGFRQSRIVLTHQSSSASAKRCFLKASPTGDSVRCGLAAR
jgi:hypothetical protein